MCIPVTPTGVLGDPCGHTEIFLWLWVAAAPATCASVFCSGHLRPAAKAASVTIPDGHRWSLHNLRHSLSNWLVNKAKENPKTVQGILRHSRIRTTLVLYTDEDLDEMIAAQEKFLDAVGFEAETVHCGMWVRLWVRVIGVRSDNSMRRVAGTTRLEIATSAVTESLADVTYWNLTVPTARSYSSKGTQGNSLAGLLDPDRTRIGRSGMKPPPFRL